jgi:hypothetical protein
MGMSQGVDLSSVQPNSELDAHKLIAEIVWKNQPLINRFVSVQRQQFELGDKDLIRNAVLPLPDMTVYYQNVQGLERMHYHIAPKFEAPPEKEPEPPAEVKAPEPPEPDGPPPDPKIDVPEPKVPEDEKPPEPDKPPEEEPFVPPEVPEPPEEEKQKGEPEFLSIEMMFGLAVEFFDGAD